MFLVLDKFSLYGLTFHFPLVLNRCFYFKKSLRYATLFCCYATVASELLLRIPLCYTKLPRLQFDNHLMDLRDSSLVRLLIESVPPARFEV